MKRETVKEKKDRAQAIASRLAQAFPEVRVPLHHRNPYELLVATILSAQCTDEMVNRVTPELFRLYAEPEDLAKAPVREIEKVIRPLGLFRSKARNLKQCTRQLIEKHGGEVPGNMQDLTRLAGVGRKTANVILGHAFGIPGIVVDTHCKRLSRRLGLTRQEEPSKIERDLMKLMPDEYWTSFSHRLILHGRKVCHARKPQCQICTLNDLCPSAIL
ncbi:MAG: endonuclease III [Candidatus Binatia bacterium]